MMSAVEFTWPTLLHLTLRFTRRWLVFLVMVGACGISTGVRAAELLQNRSFEAPVVPADGNNFYTTIPNWSVIDLSPVVGQPFNVIRPTAAYANNPSAPPTGGGIQYLDITSASGTLTQTVSLTQAGVVSLSGWFSVRDSQQTLSGMIVRLRDSVGTIVASAAVSFDASEPIGLWKIASVANVPLSAGTYAFEAVIPNNANFDLASVNYSPPLAVTKASSVVQDPVSGVSNPKFIPGAVAQYAITVSSPADYAVSAGSLAVIDPTPSNMALVVSDIAGAGSGPVQFSPGATTLTLPYSSLSSTTDNVDFSADNGATWTYVPSPGSNGTDPAVTTIRLRPSGTMAANTSFSLQFRYVVN